MGVVTISGAVEGHVARVDSEGRMLTAVLPPITAVEQSSPIAAAGVSAQVVAPLAGRTRLLLQNLGAFPVHLSFAGPARPATPIDLMVPPGATHEMCCYSRYEGAVQAVAVGGASQLAVVEFYTE